MSEAPDRTHSQPSEASSDPLVSRPEEGVKEIRSAQRHLLWGWSRLALGLVQMGLAAWAVVLLITQGLSARFWILIAASTLATAASRLLFGGRKRPPT